MIHLYLYLKQRLIKYRDLISPATSVERTPNDAKKEQLTCRNHSAGSANGITLQDFIFDMVGVTRRKKNKNLRKYFEVLEFFIV